MSIELVVVSRFLAEVRVPSREIVVPIDPDSTDHRALDTASRVARQVGASIALVAVAPPLVELPEEWRPSLRRLVSDLYPVPARAIIARADSVADGLMASIADHGAAVVCMTTEAPGRLRDAFDLASSSAVLHHVDCPVLLVGPEADADRPLGEVIAFVDDSAAADAVVEAAAGWAVALEVPMWVIEVVDPRTRVSADVNETAYVARLAHRHQRPGLDVEWDVVRDRDPAEAIDQFLRTEHPTALAVLGSHGRSGWAELRMGSVSMRTVHGAPCPVLVVPVRPS